MSSWRAERLGRSSSRGMLHPCGSCRCGIAKHIPRPAIPANHWNLLSWKAQRPCRSTAGRLRATRDVLIGCQVSAGCRVQRRLTRRLPLPSRDGQRSACPAPGAALGAGQSRGRGVAASGCAGGSRGRAPRRWRTSAVGLPSRLAQAFLRLHCLTQPFESIALQLHCRWWQRRSFWPSHKAFCMAPPLGQGFLARTLHPGKVVGPFTYGMVRSSQESLLRQR
jgi:hypothetical protein